MCRPRPLIGIATQGPCVPSGGFYVLFDEVAETIAANAKDEEEDKLLSR